MVEQPTGTVTMLFTDIEGSTRLLERLGPGRYREALEVHRRLLREAFARHSGYEVDYEGDAFFVAFASAEEAVAAASEGQQSLAQAEWPEEGEIRVRMGLHTGEPVAAPPKYVGLDVHKAARIMAAGHGGQVLVSQATQRLVGGVELASLGEHRLKDLLQPEPLYHVRVEGLPSEFGPGQRSPKPLRSRSSRTPTRLPAHWAAAAPGAGTAAPEPQRPHRASASMTTVLLASIGTGRSPIPHARVLWTTRAPPRGTSSSLGKESQIRSSMLLTPAPSFAIRQ
jgi:class 3 adenylate cyclase